MIAKGSDLSMNAQRTLNECSINAQGVLKEHSMISSISQWSLSDLSMNAKFFHPKGEMAEKSTSAQGSHKETDLLMLLGDRAYFWSPNGWPPISVLCKVPLRYFTQEVKVLQTKIWPTIIIHPTNKCQNMTETQDHRRTVKLSSVRCWIEEKTKSILLSLLLLKPINIHI